MLAQGTAWPAQGIEEGRRIDDYTWGYLWFDEDGHAHFDDTTTPTRDEILARWRHYLKDVDIE